MFKEKKMSDFCWGVYEPIRCIVLSFLPFSPKSSLIDKPKLDVISSTGELSSHSDFHLFKVGIKPMWEDEANKCGGKWIVRLR